MSTPRRLRFRTTSTIAALRSKRALKSRRTSRLASALAPFVDRSGDDPGRRLVVTTAIVICKVNRQLRCANICVRPQLDQIKTIIGMGGSYHLAAMTAQMSATASRTLIDFSMISSQRDKAICFSSRGRESKCALMLCGVAERDG